MPSSYIDANGMCVYLVLPVPEPAPTPVGAPSPDDPINPLHVLAFADLTHPSEGDFTDGVFNALNTAGELPGYVTAGRLGVNPIPSAGQMGLRAAGKLAGPVGLVYGGITGYQKERGDGHSQFRSVTIGGGSALAGFGATALAGAAVSGMLVAGPVGAVGAVVIVVGVGYVSSHAATGILTGVFDYTGW